MTYATKPGGEIEAGWPLHAVSKWLGHQKITTTETYLNATTQLLL